MTGENGRCTRCPSGSISVLGLQISQQNVGEIVESLEEQRIGAFAKDERPNYTYTPT